ncbi:MAG: recombinase family protein, partial [Alphaproteobacteria bacterium]
MYATPDPDRAPRRAVLYTRVSTDEQADRGFSLRDQEARLRTYCTRAGIEAVAHFQDDHSARTFDRPAFRQLLAFLRAHRGRVDLLLVVKWDRFSRDDTGALGMIRTLEELGVEVQAIEQPIDWRVPEQRMMLAIYVTAPEIENRRRSLATKAGMRRAMQEGRWCAKPPKGYRRVRDEHDRMLIVPNEDAPFIRRAFEAVARLDVSLEEIRRRLSREGFRCSKNQFRLLLRNPVYMGKIVVPAWRDEPEELVDGVHEALVSEALFRQVQQRLRARRSGTGTTYRHVRLRPELVLRGHLLCAACGKLLTGSVSQGNGGRYGYY